MDEKRFTPQEVIIKELLEQSSSKVIHDLSTLRFLKMHTTVHTRKQLGITIREQYQLHWITCSTTTSTMSNYLFLLQGFEDGSNWDLGGVFPGLPIDRTERGKGEVLPKAYLGFSQDHTGLSRPTFFAYGEIVEHGISIVRVRLVSTNGVQLDDSVEQGLVLFVGDAIIEHPVWVELYDETETCINRHTLMDYERRKKRLVR